MIGYVAEMSEDLISIDDFKSIDFLAQLFSDKSSFAGFQTSDSLIHERQLHESSELFSDLVLDYINQMLMEEDTDDKYDLLQTHPDLEATEKPFYDLIGEKYPPSPDQPPFFSASSPESSGCNRSSFHSMSEFSESQNDQISPSESSPSSADGGRSFGDGLDQLREDQFADLFFKSIPASQFEKGVEEAKKFLPSEDKLVINVGEVDLTSLQEPMERRRQQKNRHGDESGLEELRRSKQSAFCNLESEVPPEMFEDLLFCDRERFPKVVNAIREKMYIEASRGSKATELKESGGGRKSRRKKQLKDELVDINTLLLHCAQTVASGDSVRAYELLRQIRQHSTPHGEASQRIAHYFADGLEARLAGTGTEVYRFLVARRKTVGDMLKAYQLYLAACPFKTLSYCFANKTILETIQSATRVHILDFGIYFGFQWPDFIKLLSVRPGGPPKLRITGIDSPLPGFRPAERIEETGRRLADYAARFGVPFEYHAVAAKFDEIKFEELHIEEDEMLVVNCLFRMHCLADETVMVDCPRDKVLKNIRKLNPAVFVNVVVNGAFGAPFFMTRFREALYHFSAMFDMLDATVPRENEARLLVESGLYAQLLINIIACEGLERNRPETYKQWQVRCRRAGFEQLPIRKEFAEQIKEGIRSYYHKDFSVDEDGRWLLEGWKGRIIYGLSAWKPRSL